MGVSKSHKLPNIFINSVLNINGDTNNKQNQQKLNLAKIKLIITILKLINNS